MLTATRMSPDGTLLGAGGGLGYPDVSSLSRLASGAVNMVGSLSVATSAGSTATMAAGCNISASAPAVGGTTPNTAGQVGCQTTFPNVQPGVAPPMPVSPAISKILATRASGGKMTMSKYIGTIARYNTSRKIWSIYRPGTLSGISVGLGDACLFGTCGLGAAGDVTPPAPGAKLEELPAKPAESQDGGKESDGPPWYKNWKTYAIAGGVLAVGLGGWYVLK